MAYKILKATGIPDLGGDDTGTKSLYTSGLVAAGISESWIGGHEATKRLNKWFKTPDGEKWLNGKGYALEGSASAGGSTYSGSTTPTKEATEGQEFNIDGIKYKVHKTEDGDFLVKASLYSAGTYTPSYTVNWDGTNWNTNPYAEETTNGKTFNYNGTTYDISTPDGWFTLIQAMQADEESSSDNTAAIAESKYEADLAARQNAIEQELAQKKYLTELATNPLEIVPYMYSLRGESTPEWYKQTNQNLTSPWSVLAGGGAAGGGESGGGSAGGSDADTIASILAGTTKSNSSTPMSDWQKSVLDGSSEVSTTPFGLTLTNKDGNSISFQYATGFVGGKPVSSTTGSDPTKQHNVVYLWTSPTTGKTVDMYGYEWTADEIKKNNIKVININSKTEKNTIKTKFGYDVDDPTYSYLNGKSAGQNWGANGSEQWAQNVANGWTQGHVGGGGNAWTGPDVIDSDGKGYTSDEWNQQILNKYGPNAAAAAAAGGGFGGGGGGGGTQHSNSSGSYVTNADGSKTGDMAAVIEDILAGKG